MTTIAFPDVSILFDGGNYCEPTRNDEVFESSRSRAMQVTRRGPVVWEQSVKVYTKGAEERTFQGFLDQVDGMINSVTAPDFLAETQQGLLEWQPTVWPYFDELFFTEADYEEGDSLAVVTVGAHSAGDTEISIDANWTRLVLYTSHRVQIGKGFYRITSDCETGDDGTGTITIYPALRYDVADATAVVVEGATAIWKMVEVSAPQPVSPGQYVRTVRLREDIRTVMASE